MLVFFFSFCKRKKCYNVIEFVWTRYDLCINYFYMCNRDMLPLPYATKENYKVLLYRLADLDPDKVRSRFLEYIQPSIKPHITSHITSRQTINNQASLHFSWWHPCGFQITGFVFFLLLVHANISRHLSWVLNSGMR